MDKIVNVVRAKNCLENSFWAFCMNFVYQEPKFRPSPKMVTEGVRNLNTNAAASASSASESASYTLIEREKSRMRMMHGDVKYVYQGSQGNYSQETFTIAAWSHATVERVR